MSVRHIELLRQTEKGNTYLEHLDEGHTEIEVGEVAADQTQAEEKANRDDGAQIYTAGHLDRLATVEHRGIAGENLGHDRRKGQVVRGQDDGELCASPSVLASHCSVISSRLHFAVALTEFQGGKNPFVEQDDR